MTTTLDVGIELFVEEDSARRATSVEECHCPQAYRGMSCEQCAEGYYRLPSGHCVPCQCSAHATQCDVNTGVCLVSVPAECYSVFLHQITHPLYDSVDCI